MGSSNSSEPNKAYQRRKICSDLNIEIDKDIKVYTEYIEGPRGNVLYTKCFVPNSSIISKPKGLICQSAGYTSYADYDFTLIAQEYCKKGYAFFIWDHYGHGRSSGLWIHIPNMQWLVDDAIFCCNYAKKKYSFKNTYLIGTSMGGNIVSRMLIQYQKEKKHLNYNGIVLYSPMVAVDPSHLFNPILMYILEYWVAYYWPKATFIPKSVSKDISKLSRDRNMALFMSKNPLNWPHGPRPATGVQMLKTMEYVQNNTQSIGLLDIPILVLHGTNDDVTRSTMSLQMIKDISSKQTRVDATHKLYAGGLHGLMVDSCRNECLQTVVQWMDKHNK